jgi:serine/threonine protein kinase
MSGEQQNPITNLILLVMALAVLRAAWQSVCPDNATRRRAQPLDLKPETKWLGLSYKRLGSGAFGTVYKFQDGLSGDPMAVKRMHNVNEAGAIADFETEAKQLEQAGDHPNVVQYYGYRDVPGFGKGLVMEYASKGSLRSHLGDSWSYRLQWSVQITQGLAHIHAQGIIHQDIKSDNVLIDENNDAKITDFGIARYRHAFTYGGKTIASFPAGGVPGGTYTYLSPEIGALFCSPNPPNFFSAGRWGTTASDIFSLGVLLCELATQKAPDRSQTDIVNGKVDTGSLWRKNSMFASIVEKCIQLRPSDRPSAQQVLQDLSKISR